MYVNVSVYATVYVYVCVYVFACLFVCVYVYIHINLPSPLPPKKLYIRSCKNGDRLHEKTTNAYYSDFMDKYSISV